MIQKLSFGLWKLSWCCINSDIISYQNMPMIPIFVNSEIFYIRLISLGHNNYNRTYVLVSRNFLNGSYLWYYEINPYYLNNVLFMRSNYLLIYFRIVLLIYGKWQWNPWYTLIKTKGIIPRAFKNPFRTWSYFLQNWLDKKIKKTSVILYEHRFFS